MFFSYCNKINIFCKICEQTLVRSIFFISKISFFVVWRKCFKLEKKNFVLEKNVQKLRAYIYTGGTNIRLQIMNLHTLITDLIGQNRNQRMISTLI